jgi:AmiR/NasT family two-component response regulator
MVKSPDLLSDKKPIRVLVAEDEQMSAAKIERLLTDHGYVHVGTAANGKEAEEMTASLRPDVVLMDVQMPEMDGLTATRRIQKACPTPVVILTAYETSEFIEEASEAGASAYLMKPPNASEIDRAIIIALARHGDLMKCKALYEELSAEKQRLEEAMTEIKTLREFLPICSFCKKIRDDEGYWEQIENYIHKHTGANFSHSICPECTKKHYPEIL